MPGNSIPILKREREREREGVGILNKVGAQVESHKIRLK